MIAEQLAGKRLVAQEVIAIERGDLSPLDFRVEPMDNQQQERARISLILPRFSLRSLSAYFPPRLVALALIVVGVFVTDLFRRP